MLGLIKEEKVEKKFVEKGMWRKKLGQLKNVAIMGQRQLLFRFMSYNTLFTPRI